MASKSIEVQRPQRWDHPLSPDMQAADVAWLMKQKPFSQMDGERFARNTSLPEVLRHDCRLVHLLPGDVVFREGQYGGTAYLVLTGNIRVFLTRLLAAGDRPTSSSGDLLKRIIRSLKAAVVPRAKRVDSRRNSRSQANSNAQAAKSSTDARPADNLIGGGRRAEPDECAIGYRGEGTQTRIFLQDVPGALSQHLTSAVGPGELFGELAAVTRSPREYTAIAESECLLLEIRWQGLKLLRQDPAFKQLLDERYRSDVLRTHLRETPLFRFIPEEHLQAVVAAAKLESFGNLEWYAEYRKQSKQSTQSPATRIEAEPLVAEEGGYATGLWIVRGGFARLSRRQGAGHRTVAYLGKGQMFGLSELVHNREHCSAPPLPYQESLRAIGYVDMLCIPKQTTVEHVLPFIRRTDLPAPIVAPRYQFGQPVVDAPLDVAEHRVETGLLEFLVDERLMNGQQAMVIDTERCTRCDDCVRACAKTHQGVPVFVREGPQYGPWMFAHACMHCEDPVCMIGCPTGAIHRDLESGLVKINPQTCIGCKTCAESCPYENIRMVIASDGQGRAKVDQTTGLPILQASKCDLCSSAGGKPVCQSACPHDALVRLNLTELKKVGKHLQGKAA